MAYTRRALTGENFTTILEQNRYIEHVVTFKTADLKDWNNSFRTKNYDFIYLCFPTLLGPRGTQKAINHLSMWSGSPARAGRLILASISASFTPF